MMDPIKFKDEAYQAKTRAALPDSRGQRTAPVLATSVALAARKLASALR